MTDAGQEDRGLDRLYREPPERFVELRDELAKELKEAGETERAAEVKKLRRPSNAAFVVNRLAHEHAGAVQELVDAAAELRSAYEEGDGRRMRTAAQGERAAIDVLVRRAGDEARDAGITPNSALLARVTETLQAVSGDADTRRAVQAGRLDRERKVATLGMPVASSPRPPDSARSRELTTARRELKRLTQKLGVARGRLEKAQGAVARAEERLGEARERASSAQDSVGGLEAQVEQAQLRVDELE